MLAILENSFRIGGYAGSRGAPLGFLSAIFGPMPGYKVWMFAGLALFEGGLFLFFCLNQAARRLAPPAENHSSASRILALGLPGPVVLVAWFGAPEYWLVQFRRLRASAIFFICALEVSVVAEPMRVHVREWAGAPGWCWPLGRLSAAGVAERAALRQLPAGLSFAIAFTFDRAGNPWFALPFFFWCLVLAWAALVLPGASLSLLGAPRRVVPAG